MDVYILDNMLRRTQVIDRFESFIWTERYSAEGDFQWVIRSTVEARSLLVINSLLVIKDSTRVMRIDTVENKTDDTGKAVLNISGKSIEHILVDRGTRGNLNNLTDTPKWTLTGTPASIARQLFQAICVTGVLNVGDKIPFYVPGSTYPPSTIPEDTQSKSLDVPIGTLYDILKQICDVSELGFRLYRDDDTAQLHFDVYQGSDRTSGQFDLALPVVIFSAGMGNLANVTELTSTASLKNVCYVIHPLKTLTVYAEGVNADVAGFERHAMIVDASDVNLPLGPSLDFYLNAKGQQALAENKNLVAFDGEIPKQGSYTYGKGKDYDLGDLVEMHNTDGLISYLRVTEQIFAADAEGERNYPTLSVDIIITPGSWFALNSRLVWSDADGAWIDDAN